MKLTMWIMAMVAGLWLMAGLQAFGGEEIPAPDNHVPVASNVVGVPTDVDTLKASLIGLAGLVASILIGRFIQALRNGQGLKGAVAAVWLGTNGPTVKVLACFLGLAVLASGCATNTINTPQGKILSVTERGLGFHIVTSSASSTTPNVDFGFWSSAVVIIPTSTNTSVNAPNFANKFDFAQSGPLQLGIGEDIASGNYQALKAGATNSAVVIQPVTPK